MHPGYPPIDPNGAEKTHWSDRGHRPGRGTTQARKGGAVKHPKGEVTLNILYDDPTCASNGYITNICKIRNNQAGPGRCKYSKCEVG